MNLEQLHILKGGGEVVECDRCLCNECQPFCVTLMLIYPQKIMKKSESFGVPFPPTIFSVVRRNVGCAGTSSMNGHINLFERPNLRQTRGYHKS
jgi:hypothetical protein